jgi:hypothetical protein
MGRRRIVGLGLIMMLALTLLLGSWARPALHADVFQSPLIPRAHLPVVARDHFVSPLAPERIYLPLILRY